MTFKTIVLIVITSIGLIADNVYAERAWSGHLHFVDCHLRFDFGGYEYANMEELRYTDIDLSRAYGLGDVRLSMVGDDDNPLQATFRGDIRVHVDGWDVEVTKLRLVRKHKHAQLWRVHPDDIKTMHRDAKHRSSRAPASNRSNE